MLSQESLSQSSSSLLWKPCCCCSSSLAFTNAIKQLEEVIVAQLIQCRRTFIVVYLHHRTAIHGITATWLLVSVEAVVKVVVLATGNSSFLSSMFLLFQLYIISAQPVACGSGRINGDILTDLDNFLGLLSRIIPR